MKGVDDIDVCTEAFRLRIPEAPEITRRRIAYWQVRGGAAADKIIDQLRTLLRDNLKKWAPKQVDEGPTPETSRSRRRVMEQQVESLYLLGYLDDDQIRHAREIAQIVRHATVGTPIKIMRLPVPSEVTDDDNKSAAERAASIADRAAWLALLHHNVYRPWAQRRAADMPMLLGLIVDENSIETLRKRYRKRWSTVMKMVTDSLDEYAAVRRNYVRRGVQPNPEALPPRLAEKFRLRGASALAH